MSETVDTVNIFNLISLPAGCAKCIPAGIVFTYWPIFGFFAPQGQHVAPIKVKFGREEQTILPCQISP